MNAQGSTGAQGIHKGYCCWLIIDSYIVKI